MDRADCVLDTNILVYSTTDRGLNSAGHPNWSRRSDGGSRHTFCRSSYVVVTRKVRHPLTPGDAAAYVRAFREFACASIDADLVETAISLSEQFKISYWDAAIVAAAGVLGAPIVYSEDLDHGQQYGSVRVINPFVG